MRTALYYIGIGLILVLFLNSSGPNLDIPSYQVTHGNIIANMNCTSIHSILMRREYNYFLDTFTSTDKYEQIMEIYANPR